MDFLKGVATQKGFHCSSDHQFSNASLICAFKFKDISM